MVEVREALGQAAFSAAVADGRAMSLDEAIDYALSVAALTVNGDSAKQRDANDRRRELLTPREREVAILIAHGWSNRAIAARLVISERTAETHIRHIFTKLEVDARAQIAAWVVQRGLLPSSGNSPAGAGPTA